MTPPRICPDCEGPMWSDHPTCLTAIELAASFERSVARMVREEAACSFCGGLGGAHGLVHRRFPEGGGGVNVPCPAARP